MYTYNAKVVRVIDGDTVELEFDLGFNTTKTKRVRLLGINAPETRTKDKKEKVRGLQAKLYLTQLLLDGPIIVKSERYKVDGFGRYLATIWVHTPTSIAINVCQQMVESGHAVPYRR